MVNLYALERHIEYCVEIDDVASLFIIHDLLTPRSTITGNDFEVYESKIELYRKFKNFVAKKWFLNNDVPRQLETIFEVSFSILQKKGIIIPFMLSQDVMDHSLPAPDDWTKEEIEYEIEHSPIQSEQDEEDFGVSGFILDLDEPIQNYNKEKIAHFKHICLDGIVKPRELSFPEKTDFDIRDAKDFPKPSDATEDKIAEFLNSQTNEDIVHRRLRKFNDPKYWKNFDWAKAKLSKDFAEFYGEEFPKDEDLDHDEWVKQQQDDWKEKKIQGLSRIGKNKMVIDQMLEDTEIQIRDLLIWIYGSTKDWIRKEFVPKDVIKGKFGKGELIDQKAEASIEMGGTPLDPARAFLNACTLGELIAIILHKPNKFVDVFDDAKLVKTKVFLEELKKIRNPRAHADESIPWDDDMVGNTKTYTNFVMTKILAWKEK